MIPATIHLLSKKPNLELAAGTLLLEINTADQVVRDPVGNIVFQGPVEVKLVNGEATVQVPPTDDPTLSPTGFSYRATEKLGHVNRTRYRQTEFFAPTGTTVDLADVASTDEVAADPSWGANLNGVLAELDERVPKAAKQVSDATSVTMFTIEPASAAAGRAKFSLVHGNATFDGVKDPLLFLGYNAAHSVAPGDARVNEPVLRLGFEGFYRAVNWAGTGQTQDTMEVYVEAFNSARTITDFRPWAVTMGRETRWATTQIEIGTDASTAKSQFFVKGKSITLGATTTDNVFRVDNDRISSNLQHSHNGAPVNMVTFPSGKNAHLFFIQDDGAGNQTTNWYLANFGGDPNHYLWNQTHGRYHVMYQKGATNTAALTEFQSSVKVDGNVGFYGTTPVTKQTGVAVTAAGVHAALVNLGLIAA